MIHDRDTKFTKQFDDIFRSDGLEVIKTPYKNPNLNAHCEQVIQTIKHEALDYFVVFGEDLLNLIVSFFVECYNTLRPHQGVQNVPISGTVSMEQSVTVDPDEVV